MDEDISNIRFGPLKQEDCEAVSFAFKNQGWDKPVSQFEQYLILQNSGERDVILARENGVFAGYLTILWVSTYNPFRAASIPEIVDFNVLKQFQRRGIGSRLMDEAERRIAQQSPVAGIGVGLVEDYGPAQVLYVKRGYIPDGTGASYDSRPLAYHTTLTAGDDLILHMTKKLR